jgi:cation transport ATPase
VLRYATSALRDLDDERTTALRAECLARRISLLDRLPIDFGTDVTLHHQGQVVKVGNLGGRGPSGQAVSSGRGEIATRSIDSLMVGINGQIAGLIDFRASSRLRAAAAIHELRSQARRPLAVGLVSPRRDPFFLDQAAALGVDFNYGGLSSGELALLIRGCQRRGLKVAYLGECLKRGRAAREADVAISLDAEGLEHLDRNPAAIVLLRPDLSGLALLGEASRVHRNRILSAQGGAFVPNLICAAGALFLGFSSLTSVVLTNLGTGSTYARTVARMHRLRQSLRRSAGRRSVSISG